MARAGTIWQFVLIVGATYGVIAGGLFWARQNLRSGRGDRRGATRLMFAYLFLLAVSWLLGEHHVWPGSGEWNLFYMFAGRALINAGILWALYIAMEPLVRRRWPHVLITWARVLSGDFRDPLVGRDILIGCAAAMILRCENLIPTWFGSVPTLRTPNLNAVLRTGTFISSLFAQLAQVTLVFTLGFILFVFFLRLLVRHDWPAIVIAALILTTTDTAFIQNPWTIGPFVLISNICIFFVLVRFGLVAFFSGALALLTFVNAETGALQASAWYSGYGFAALLFTAALTFYGFHTSLGGRRLFDITTVGG
jgi:serine/threonine-protein kinase